METNQTNDIFEGRPKQLPGMLNVLTILTFIGCGLAYLGSIWQMVSNTDPEKQAEKINQAMDKLSSDSFMYKWLEGSLEVARKTHDNRYLVFIAAIVFTTMCLIGAIQMRKLKKNGYFIYLVGELAPFAITVGLFGTGIAAMIQLGIGGLIAVIFIILYSTQIKYLVNK